LYKLFPIPIIVILGEGMLLSSEVLTARFGLWI